MAINHRSLYERNIATVVQQAEASLGPILNELGTILYSSCETLKRGKYYFLGLNPGGGSERTISQSLVELAHGKPTENAYFDQNWSGKRTYDIGEHPYQQDFKYLFAGLIDDPRKVCATNLIFKGSRDARELRIQELARLCWPVHEAIIEIVQPEAIITFGVQAFEFIAQKRGGQPVQFAYSRPGYWSWQHSILADGTRLIGTRHPRGSARINNQVVDEIKQYLGLV
jgi:hypothetical protein